MWRSVIYMTQFVVTLIICAPAFAQPQGFQAGDSTQDKPMTPSTIITTRDGTKHSFIQPPQLADAVLTVAYSQYHSLDNIYWPAAGLYQSVWSENTKREALKPVARQVRVQKGELKQQWLALYSALLNLSIGKRIDINIDPDYVRLSKETNPKLDGQWHIQLPTRPKQVLLLGAIDKPGFYPWRVRTSAATYLKDAADQLHGQSYAWVVKPSGHAEKHPIAYWNKQHSDILPGSVIYLPLSIKDTPIDPNQSVLMYLKNRLIP
ncbi:hypothetical protein BZJ17_14905 [Salinivibrio sp. IB574]|nr:hypothetical protein BZJ17_14905 [Salinivibrio sp. IB574]